MDQLMTRYEITPVDPEHVVSVGWDNPLQTFFVHVDRVDRHEDEDALLWRGADYGEIKRAEDLRELVRPYATLSIEIMAQLRHDRAKGLDQGPTSLQRNNLNFLAGVMNAYRRD